MRSSFGGGVIDGRQQFIIVNIIAESDILANPIAFMPSQDLQHPLGTAVSVPEAPVQAIYRRICQHIFVFLDDALKVANNSSVA